MPKGFKKYKLEPDIGGICLFLFIMIPNFIWFSFPAPNDLLRKIPAKAVWDSVSSVCQIWMLVTLCAFKNRDVERLRFTGRIAAVAACCSLYFICWLIYYSGTASVLVLLGLSITPCTAFMLFAMEKKNDLAIIPAAAFTIFHLMGGISRFIS